MYAFEEFPKIARLKREVVITEKLDGTNAQIAWVALDSEDAYNTSAVDPFCLWTARGLEDGDAAMALYVGSRNRWLTIDKDHFGFAKWALEHVDELRALGVGRHYGEWFGSGIQRTYGLTEKRLALFNTARWGAHNPNTPACCSVVPILARGEGVDVEAVFKRLGVCGSIAVPGFTQPEGIVIWHSSSRTLYKQTFDMDGGKWRAPPPQFAEMGALGTLV